MRPSVGAYVGAVHTKGATTHQQRPPQTSITSRFELGMLADQWTVDRGPENPSPPPPPTTHFQQAQEKSQDDSGSVGAQTIKIPPSLAPRQPITRAQNRWARLGPAFFGRIATRQKLAGMCIPEFLTRVPSRPSTLMACLPACRALAMECRNSTIWDTGTPPQLAPVSHPGRHSSPRHLWLVGVRLSITPRDKQWHTSIHPWHFVI